MVQVDTPKREKRLRITHDNYNYDTKWNIWDDISQEISFMKYTRNKTKRWAVKIERHAFYL